MFVFEIRLYIYSYFCVLLWIMIVDAEGIDPSTVEEGDEVENVPGGQAMCVHCKYAADETEV